MAQSADQKSKKVIDEFADDLDSMLDVDDTSRQVGLIDDDDAIDRLLMVDMLASDDVSSDNLADADIDSLLEGVATSEPTGQADTIELNDDLDDIIASLDINPRRQDNEPSATLAPEMNALAEPMENDDIDDLLNLSSSAILNSPTSPVADHDESETMVEIDEFSDSPSAGAADHADFLLADFNISAEDDVDLQAKATPGTGLPDLEQGGVVVEQSPVALTEAGQDEFGDDADYAAVLGQAESAPAPALFDDAVELMDDFVDSSLTAPEADIDAGQEAAAAVSRQTATLSEELAALTERFKVLAKQFNQSVHDVHTKADKQELIECQDNIERLQTEIKKANRNLDALVNKKPVGLYVANGVAAVAMMITAGLWIDSFISKSQIEQLTGIAGELKQQVDAAPVASAASTELMQKQLDDLSVQQTVVVNQVNEFGKMLAGGGNGQKPAGDFGKQLGQLSNQDMEMGAAIEALQNKVAALEKGKVVVATKPVVKKTVVEENWAVNLIAFKQDWYAKRKAEEFATKGVPAKVTRTDSKGETWYRLSVDGYPNQAEAAAFAAKVKKSLNLDSVWVAKVKD